MHPNYIQIGAKVLSKVPCCDLRVSLKAKAPAGNYSQLPGNMTVSSNRLIRLVPAETDIIVGTIGTIGTGHTLHYGRHITLLEPQHLSTHEEQAIK